MPNEGRKKKGLGIKTPEKEKLEKLLKETRERTTICDAVVTRKETKKKGWCYHSKARMANFWGSVTRTWRVARST